MVFVIVPGASGSRLRENPCRFRQARKRRPPRRDRKKERVRSKTRTLVELGQLEPGPCKVCGAAEVQAHHLDYDAPDAHLEVEWLCVLHHAARKM